MDAKGSFHGYEQTLPVLSRPPAVAPWPATDPTPHPDAYALPNSSLAPTTYPANTGVVKQPYPAAAAPAAASASTNLTSRKSQSSTTAPGTTAERNASSKVRKQRKPANAAAGKSTLFWVNTDSESASGGTKEETLKRIRSHVMSEHNRKKRLENTKRYKSKTWKHLPFQPPDQVPRGMGPPRPPPAAPSSSPSSRSGSGSVSGSGSGSSRRGSYAVETPRIKQEIVPVSMPGTISYQTQTSSGIDTWDENDLEDFDGVVGYQPQATAPPVWTYVGSGAHDPFNTGHTQLTDRMLRHLQNCESLAALSSQISGVQYMLT